jgi:hypothetical protein
MLQVRVASKSSPTMSNLRKLCNIATHRNATENDFLIKMLGARNPISPYRSHIGKQNRKGRCNGKVQNF